MPVKHDVFADLNMTQEQIKKHRAQDNKLNQLLNVYEDIDKRVLAAESALAADDELKRLKEKRLLVKDKIVQQLSAQ